MISRSEANRLSFEDIAPGPALPPLTPGEVLLEEFMRPLGLRSCGRARRAGEPHFVHHQRVAEHHRGDRVVARASVRHQRGAVDEPADGA